MPGDLSREELIERIIRVDHAGEYGAVRIYQGQMAVLGKSPSAATLQHMTEQEKKHLDTFEKLARLYCPRSGTPPDLPLVPGLP